LEIEKDLVQWSLFPEFSSTDHSDDEVTTAKLDTADADKVNRVSKDSSSMEVVSSITKTGVQDSSSENEEGNWEQQI